MCDEKLPYYVLAQALNQRRLAHTGLQVEANSTSLVLRLLTLPMPEAKPNEKVVSYDLNEFHYSSEDVLFINFYLHVFGVCKQKNVPVIDARIRAALTKRLLSVSIRSHIRNNHIRCWTVEIIFFKSPLRSKHHREQSKK